jgi:hypothetical protein
MTAIPVAETRRALVLLADALTLLESQRSWTRKGYALDGRGRQVRVDDPHARRFCTVGAVLRAEHERNATPIPVATDPRPEIEDLDLPIAPDAPFHVAVALQLLGVAALEELHVSGYTIRRRDQSLSLAHVPMVLALRRELGHTKATAVLVRAIALAAELAIGETPGRPGAGAVE